MSGAIPESNGPDLHPRKPDFTLPPGACDCHCHVFGPQDKFPFSPARKYTPPDAPKEDLARLHGAIGVERAVLVQASSQGNDNGSVIDTIASNPDNYRGVGMIGDEAGEDELAALHAQGMRGVRFTVLSHLGGAPDIGRFEHLLQRIAPFGWHADLHTDAADLPPFAEASARLGVPIVIDHMAKVRGMDGEDEESFNTLMDVVRGENCWVKLSCADRVSGTRFPYMDMAPVARALIEAAPGRVIWGTDWPHVNARDKNPPNDGDLVDFLPLYLPEEDLQNKLLVQNPARLYGFPPI
ncbi:MAG: amidohydrolase family protein [Rhodospirillales bacterium]|nr:amidohydrolase family protein [Rhodospirillales bacterium]